MPNFYTVFAVLRAIPGKELALKKALHEVLSAVRAGNGCINFNLFQDQHDPAQFVWYSNWISKEAHQYELQQPHIKALGQLLDELAESEQIIFCDEVFL